MGDSPGQLSIADFPATLSFDESEHGGSSRTGLFLLLETVLLTTAVILAIGALAGSSFSGISWFASPAVLVTAALVPAILRADRFAQIGLNLKQVKRTVPVVCCTCLVVFPATFAALWLLKARGLDLPLRVVPPQNQQWLSWLFYQFMYVAVAEEVFFRGYVLSNILRITSTMKWAHSLRNCVSIVLSAACFAAAHMIVQGQIVSVLTFLPGLVLGWLFVRTRSLLAPILFHGIANTCYAICAAALA